MSNLFAILEPTPTQGIAALATMLAREPANLVLRRPYGLCLGASILQALDALPCPIADFLSMTPGGEALLSAHRFDSEDWEASWADTAFPAVFLQRGGILQQRFIKILFVNSFEPRLKFVYPYPPTERLAAALRSETDFVEAAVYDPNLEPAEVVQSFPRHTLQLLAAVEKEKPEIIVQAVFNVDYDLQLLCSIRERAPRAHIYIGGPHLATADHASYLEALPVDGVIVGDGRTTVLALARNLWEMRTEPVPGLVTRHLINSKSTPRAPTSRQLVVLPERQEIAGLQSSFPNVWGLSSYESRGAIVSDGQRLLPYDVIGLTPYRVLTSQRCGKACYWCRSPKGLPPRNPIDVVDEIERRYATSDSLHFDDNEIWFDPRNVQRLAAALQARGLTEKPVLVKTTTDQMTPERAELLRAVGVRIVAFGVESFSQECLDALKKGTSVAQNHRALGVTLDAGIKAGINLIWLVPGITPDFTRQLIDSVLPYLQRGAYVNLVPELELGDLRRGSALNALISSGEVRNDPRRLPGMRSSIDYFGLELSAVMRQFKKRVTECHETLIENLCRRPGAASLSVASWSVLFLRAIVQTFPDDAGWSAADRCKADSDLEVVLDAVQRAEREHLLIYSELK